MEVSDNLQGRAGLRFEWGCRPPTRAKKLLKMGRASASAIVDRNSMDSIAVDDHEIGVASFGGGASAVGHVSQLNS